MDYDILIATRNRQQALRLSLPRMLSQNRLPRCVIIVDSSDDHDLTRKTLSEVSASASGGIDFQIYEAEAGTASQRNFGLKQVQSPIVVIPDDDSMWFPGVAEGLLRLYEQDRDGILGGVGAQQSSAPPTPPFLRKHYLIGVPPITRRLYTRLAGRISKVEYSLFPDPFFIEALDRYKNRPVPAWLPANNAVFSATMTGFRMSFRTEVIQKIGFDTALGRYALFEDHDACLAVLKDHAIARAKAALVFHRVSPGYRAAPEEIGCMHILNRAYITYKHSPEGSMARMRLPKFCLYKLLRYLPRVFTGYGRLRFMGAFRAFSLMPRLKGLSGRELKECYVTLRNNCLSGIRPPA